MSKVVHFEIPADNVDRAKNFYGSVFGWELQTMPMGEGEYTTVKTTAGPVTIERPKLRGTDEAFASRLLGVGVCRTNALESLVIAGFVRGLSVRDVEATLADEGQIVIGGGGDDQFV